MVQKLETMGTNMLFVEAGNRQIQGVRTAYNTMMFEDVVAVRSQCPAVALASPNVDLRAQVGFENQNWNTQINGVDMDYRLIRHWNDDIIVIPWTTAQRKMLGIRYIKDMYISVVSREMIGMAKQQITVLLRQRHHLRPDQPDDFSIRDYTEIADMVN